uniref:Uncharacterized protein n=1 Tax=Trichogramma kaykai TaxID=54128 RepID=A0ABD2WPR7_9HYME
MAAYAASTAVTAAAQGMPYTCHANAHLCIQVKPVMTTTAADDDYHDDENEYQYSDLSFFYQITKSFRVYIATAAAVASTAASVNGQDVSNSSHEDAVRCFESAQEPILVEVLRRQQFSSSTSHTTTPTTTTTTVLAQHNSNGNGNNNVSGSSPSTSSQSSSPHDEGNASSGNNSSSPAQQQQPQQMDENSRENAFTLLVSTAVQTDWAGLVDDDEDDDEFGVTLRPQDADEQTNDSLDDILAHDIDFEVEPNDDWSEAGGGYNSNSAKSCDAKNFETFSFLRPSTNGMNEAFVLSVELEEKIYIDLECKNVKPDVLSTSVCKSEYQNCNPFVKKEDKHQAHHNNDRKLIILIKKNLITTITVDFKRNLNARPWHPRR